MKEPRFRVGDKVRNKEGVEGTVISVWADGSRMWVEAGPGMYYLAPPTQWELVEEPEDVFGLSPR